MKVLLIQYGLNMMSFPPVCGNSGKIYGRAKPNTRLERHEFEMPLDKFQDPMTHRDLFNALRRPGQQWMPLFLDGDKPASPVSIEQANELQDILRTLTNSGTALITSARELVQSLETTKAEIEALKSELIGDEAEAVGGDLQESKQPIPLENRGMNYLRRAARKLGHKLAGNPSKQSLITFITEKQAEPAAV